MLNARLSVTLIGKPSGTDTTIRVTATMKYFKILPAVSKVKIVSAVKIPAIISFVSNPTKVTPATVKPIILINLARPSSCLLSGVLS